MNDLSSHRRRLFSVAYRMLGSVSDAEDVVQEVYLRATRIDFDKVHSIEAYLTTMTTRLAIDQLRAVQRRREQYVGTWLPEPVVDPIVMASTSPAPDQTAALAESLSLAFLLVLEELNPNERAAFLLHDVFGYAFDEVAEILDQPVVNCRQLASRGRRRIRSDSPSRTQSDVSHPISAERLASEFLDACRSGNLAKLVTKLADDAVVYSDGGGVVPSALVPVRGADRVARLMIGIAKKGGSTLDVQVACVNGTPGLVGLDGEKVRSVLSLHACEGRIMTICIVNNPKKLAHVVID